MNCTYFHKVLADYIAGELAPERHADAQRHAAECRACADELAGLQSAAAVLDSGRLGHTNVVQATDSLLLPTAPRVTTDAGPRHYGIPIWARYAAVMVVAFAGGYLFRDNSTVRRPTEPHNVSNAVSSPAAFIERYNSLAHERPNAPSFTRSLLAVAAPARSK